MLDGAAMVGRILLTILLTPTSLGLASVRTPSSQSAYMPHQEMGDRG